MGIRSKKFGKHRRNPMVASHNVGEKVHNMGNGNYMTSFMSKEAVPKKEKKMSYSSSKKATPKPMARKKPAKDR